MRALVWYGKCTVIGGKIKTAKSYKISYTCSCHFLGYLAVEVSFIRDFDVIRKQRVPEKIDLRMDLLLSCFFYRW